MDVKIILFNRTTKSGVTDIRDRHVIPKLKMTALRNTLVRFNSRGLPLSKSDSPINQAPAESGAAGSQSSQRSLTVIQG